MSRQHIEMACQLSISGAWASSQNEICGIISNNSREETLKKHEEKEGRERRLRRVMCLCLSGDIVKPSMSY